MNKKIFFLGALTLCTITVSIAMKRGKKPLHVGSDTDSSSDIEKSFTDSPHLKSMMKWRKKIHSNKGSWANITASPSDKKIKKQIVHFENVLVNYSKKKRRQPGWKKRRKPSQKNRKDD